MHMKNSVGDFFLLIYNTSSEEKRIQLEPRCSWGAAAPPAGRVEQKTNALGICAIPGWRPLTNIPVFISLLEHWSYRERERERERERDDYQDELHYSLYSSSTNQYIILRHERGTRSSNILHLSPLLRLTDLAIPSGRWIAFQ